MSKSESLSEAERFVVEHPNAPPGAILAMLLHGPEIERAYKTLKDAIAAKELGVIPNTPEQLKP